MASTAQFYLGGYEAKTCPEKLRKDYDPAYAGFATDQIPAGDLARMESGIVFEANVKEIWQAALGKKFVAVPECDRSAKSKKEREKLTMELIANPGNVLIIWNARLPQDRKTHRTGEPDALIRVGKGPDGKPQWAPIDVKDHSSLEGTSKRTNRVSTFTKPHPGKAELCESIGKPRKSDALQLAHYQRMLENLGYSDPENRGGIVGRDLAITWHDLDEKLYAHSKLGSVNALSYYDYEFEKRVAIATLALSGEAEAAPEWKSECASCKWRTVCKDELKLDLDHITLLPGITPTRAGVHYKQGISTIKDLARLDWKTATLVAGGIDLPKLMWWADTVDPSASVDTAPIPSDHIALVKKQGFTTAEAIGSLDPKTAAYCGTKVWDLPKSIDRARVASVKKVHLARGVTKVGLERVTVEQDIDIEDYNGYVYLIGVRTTWRRKNGADTKERTDHKSFATWDKTDQGEAKVFSEFWTHITGWLQRATDNRWGYRSYYFTHHEPSSFKRLARKHQGQPGVPTVEEVEAYFARREVIDLAQVLQTELIWPTESLGLKEMAKWVRFSWRDDEPGGGNSMAWYTQATSSAEETEREENRTRLIEYNADDVEAQIAIRDFLTRLGNARTPGNKLPNVEALDSRFKRKRAK